MKSTAVVFVFGDREWTDVHSVEEVVGGHAPGSWLLNGGCRGADLIGNELAYKLGFQPIRMDALWRFHGRRAGPIRNRNMGVMLVSLRDAGHLLACYAFHNDLERSRGTKDMAGVLDLHGIPWVHITSEAPRVG